MTSQGTIVWFRRDFRLEDNEALSAACARGGPVYPVYILAPEEESPWQPGAASRWWLHHALANLEQSLCRRRSRLIVRRGKTHDLLRELLKVTRSDALFWNRLYDPATAARDDKIERMLGGNGVDVQSFSGALLFEPEQAMNAEGRPYQVFTPFWKNALGMEKPAPPLPAPSLRNPERWPESVSLEELALLPKVDWAAGLRETWDAGEAGGRKALDDFVSGPINDYSEDRNRPDRQGTSRLSPYLNFGQVSPRQVWHAVHDRRRGVSGAERESMNTFLAEIGWREFAHHVLHFFPQTPEEPLRENFRSFPWRTDEHALAAWQKGRTGYPLVDAGMRELWHTGWMHNRVRMIVASFLTKHLLIPWQEGARWFWDTLVDANLANNTMGWQWTAGCGADAAPYFRIFNPIAQGAKFDPYGAYIRRWVPEISGLPDRNLHAPWETPKGILEEAGIALGRTYPEPVVDHREARERALAAYEAVKRR